MIPAPFQYVAAASAEEAVALLQPARRRGQAAGRRALAAADDEGPAGRAVGARRRRRGSPNWPTSGWRAPDLAVGATTRHQAVATSPLVQEQVPLLARSAGLVGDPQIRHRGTIGGSLAHADPAADLPMALSALDGRVVVQGPAGRREIAADDFFQGYFETALEPEEMIVEVRAPGPARPAVGVREVHPAGQRLGHRRRRRRRRPGRLANMGPTPVRARSTEQALASGACGRGRGRARGRGGRAGCGHARGPAVPAASRPGPHPPRADLRGSAGLVACPHPAARVDRRVRTDGRGSGRIRRLWTDGRGSGSSPSGVDGRTRLRTESVLCGRTRLRSSAARRPVRPGRRPSARRPAHRRAAAPPASPPSPGRTRPCPCAG